MDGPCFNCQERHVGCHAVCEDYKAWRMEWDAARDIAIRENQRKSGLDNFLVKKALDTKKKWRSK